LFAVRRTFRTDAVMPIASWLGIVVELTDSVSFRPNDELTVSTEELGPPCRVPPPCEEYEEVVAEEDEPFDGRPFTMAVAAEAATTATTRIENSFGVPSALRPSFNGYAFIAANAGGRIILPARTPRRARGGLSLSSLGSPGPASMAMLQ